jgi:hypothetical protein
VVIASSPTPPAPPESKPAQSFFGFAPKLPSPGQVADSVVSLGDRIVSLVRGR